MKLRYTVAFIVCLLMAYPLHGGDWAFAPDAMSGGHVGPVSAIVNKGDTVISAGEDGFLEVWSNLSGNETVERFQVSPYRITAMAGRPDRDEVSLVETDGRGMFRVSAWNYRERRNIFRQVFRNPVIHVSYSMGGSFVIVGAEGATGLVFINASNGNLLPSPASLGGAVALAVTGRAERNMMVYLASGFISYRDLDSGVETHRFNAPANLSSTVLFGSNRFIAGLSPQGLTVVNAVSGEVVARDASVPAASSLLSSTGDDAFYVLINRTANAELRRHAIDQSGNLVALVSRTLPPPGGGGAYTAMDAFGGTITVGTSGGGIVRVEPEGLARPLVANLRLRITEAAVSGDTIAFLAENGAWGFIPLNYAGLSNGETVRVERPADGGNYSRITPFACEDGSTGRFIFWQDRNALALPSLRSSNLGDPLPDLEGVALRFPLRSVASFAGRAMFMDSAGNLSVVSPFRGGVPFSFSTVGLMDAAFIDSDRLLLGRSAVAGNTPFLSINLVTGETVPLPFPAQAGVILHRGRSGSVYAVTVDPQSGGTATSIFRIDPTNIAGSQRLVYFEGEHIRFSFAETPGGIAVTVGGEGATIHPAYGGTARPTARTTRRAARNADATDTAQALDKTPGFPYRLLEGGQHLVNLDRDGNLAWHDGQDGRLLAIFRLHPDGWTLQTERGITGGGSW